MCVVNKIWFAKCNPKDPKGKPKNPKCKQEGDWWIVPCQMNTDKEQPRLCTIAANDQKKVLVNRCCSKECHDRIRVVDQKELEKKSKHEEKPRSWDPNQKEWFQWWALKHRSCYFDNEGNPISRAESKGAVETPCTCVLKRLQCANCDQYGDKWVEPCKKVLDGEQPHLCSSRYKFEPVKRPGCCGAKCHNQTYPKDLAALNLKVFERKDLGPTAQEKADLDKKHVTCPEKWSKPFWPKPSREISQDSSEPVEAKVEDDPGLKNITALFGRRKKDGSSE